MPGEPAAGWLDRFVSHMRHKSVRDVHGPNPWKKPGRPPTNLLSLAAGCVMVRTGWGVNERFIVAHEDSISRRHEPPFPSGPVSPNLNGFHAVERRSTVIGHSIAFSPCHNHKAAPIKDPMRMKTPNR